MPRLPATARTPAIPPLPFHGPFRFQGVAAEVRILDFAGPPQVGVDIARHGCPVPIETAWGDLGKVFVEPLSHPLPRANSFHLPFPTAQIDYLTTERLLGAVQCPKPKAHYQYQSQIHSRDHSRVRTEAKARAEPDRGLAQVRMVGRQVCHGQFHLG